MIVVSMFRNASLPVVGVVRRASLYRALLLSLDLPLLRVGLLLSFSSSLLHSFLSRLWWLLSLEDSTATARDFSILLSLVV